MHNTQPLKFTSPPIVIGGVGGSGTRLIAESLSQIGIFIGHDLNQANDNLLFTLLFKRPEILTATNNEFSELIKIFNTGMTGSSLSNTQKLIAKKLSNLPRNQHSLEWLKERTKQLLDQSKQVNLNGPWGWKEPNSHILLSRLVEEFPQMKYIHVARNGLDMAYSSNQNQLELWGRNTIGENIEINPHFSLKYWCVIHQKLFDTKEKMGGNFYFLNFDNYCTHPSKEIDKLLIFLKINITQEQKKELKKLIKTPTSMSRFKEFNNDSFDNDDIECVKKLGFITK